MSGRGRPIEGSRDHFALVDHGELVMEVLTVDLLACDFKDAQAVKARVQAGLITGVV